MGRKYVSDDSDSDLPELDDFINKHVGRLPALQAPKLLPTTRVPTLTSPRRKATAATESTRKSTKNSVARMREHKTTTEKTTHFSSATRTRATPHRKAKSAAPIIMEIAENSEDDEEDNDDNDDDDDDDQDTAFMTAEENEEEASDFEESIWCDSEPGSVPPPKQSKQLPKEDILSQFKKLQLRSLTPDTTLSDSDEDLDSHIFKSRSPRKPLTTYRSPVRKLDLPSLSKSAESSDKENDSSLGLKLPTLTLPRPLSKPSSERPVTPPASPTKSKLVSPSKKKPRIPTPPHRPSIDAFWNPHQVNNWNDQYSPQKPLVSPKKNRFLPRDDNASDSPTTSPRKSQSPTKRTRVEIQAKKDFESQKHKICEDFFAELDEKITHGKIKELAESTNGVRFIWSKTLNSTAGRANWRRQTEKTINPDGSVTHTYHHHASIELAEKVIDDEERLLNVVAHEFCHLANFMVSGIKDQPHGRQFKAWGAKCTRLFAARGVEVTTKHSYQIDYKYIWSCTNELCQQDFKRHSKSIDPAKHACGTCRGKLVQVKPVPRKGAAAASAKAGAAGVVGGYAGFVKQHFADIKAGMAGATHKEVMQALGQRYREQKAAAATAEGTGATVGGIDDVAKALEVVTLD